MSSTGTPDAVKVACPVWTGGKSVSFYLSVLNGMDTTISFLLYGESDSLMAGDLLRKPLSRDTVFRTLVQQR
jgi:hypothetical protein